MPKWQDPYFMPKPEVGDEILVFENMEVLDRKSQCARVREVYDRTLIAELWPSGRQKISLHYIGDPGLEDNEEWRKGGAWDWGPVTKRIHALDERLRALEAALEDRQEASPWDGLSLEELKAIAEANPHVVINGPLNRRNIAAKLRAAGVHPTVPEGAAS